MSPSKPEPLVTIRSTCYNHARYVVESLNSILRQGVENVQWIIVDDASTDESVSLMEKWLEENQNAIRNKKFQVEFIKHERNIGFTRTLNEILTLVKSPFLCGLACDDKMMPHRISKSIERMSRLPMDFAGVYSDAFLIDDDGRRLPERFIERHRVFKRMPDGDLFPSLLKRNFIPAPTTMIRTDVFRQVGGYDESLCYEDYDMWLRISRKYKIAFIDEPLVEYRFHEHNLHKRITDWDIADYWIYRKHIDQPKVVKRLSKQVKLLRKKERITEEIRNDISALKIPHAKMRLRMAMRKRIFGVL